MPPTLYLLPQPLPKPPRHDDYRVRIVAPPPCPEFSWPPTYSEKTADGERTIQRTEREMMREEMAAVEEMRV